MPLSRPPKRLLGVLLLVNLFAVWSFGMARQPVTPAFIYSAHAGGGYEGLIHTSAIEAMEASYAKGYRIFELDVEWTRDHKVVLVHDWRTFSSFAFIRGWPTEKEFENAKMDMDFRPPTMDRLQAFLRKHPKAMVILDSKHDHYAFTKYIADNYPDIVPQIMPYIFNEADYEPVRKLGYRNLIFACYGSPVNDVQLIDILDRHRFFAVSSPWNRGWSKAAERSDGKWCLPEELSARGIRLILHVLNRKQDVAEARRIGATGVMSDWLIPDRRTVRHLEKDMAGWRKHPV